MITSYRPRVLEHLLKLAAPLKPRRILDFGAGDGYFASRMSELPGVEEVVPVDVVERKQNIVKPILYDGLRLPFDDATFDMAYAVDVIHHCLDPISALDDMMRCTSRYLLLKDHNYQTAFGRVVLAAMDEAGNRRFGIHSPYLYQRRWHWLNHIEQSGFRRLSLTTPLRCQTGLLATTNRLQFLALWERES